MNILGHVAYFGYPPSAIPQHFPCEECSKVTENYHGLLKLIF